jgi:hypothetical protein
MGHVSKKYGGIGLFSCKERDAGRQQAFPFCPNELALPAING